MTNASRAAWVIAALSIGVPAALAAPTNDGCVAAKEITTLPFRHVVDLTTATAEPGETLGDCAFSAWVSGSDDNSAWYRYTSSAVTSLDIDTLDSLAAGANGTFLTAYRGTCGALTEIACHGYDFEYDLSRLVVTVGAGETILIRVVGTDTPVETTLVVREGPVLRVAESFSHVIDGHPAVAGGPGGDFLVVWRESSATDRFRARRFDASGAPFGPAFTVNEAGAAGVRPEVARGGTGEFVVVWGASTGVHGRRLAADGTPLGSTFTVSPTNAYYRTEVAADSSGNFTVVWSDGVRDGVFGRRYDATGTPRGPEFAIAPVDNGYPSVAMAPSGAFVVAWTDDTGNGDVFARRFDGIGAPPGSAGPAFLVNVTTAGRQGNTGPAASMDAAGNFVVVWEDANFPSTWGRLMARRYDAAGTALGGEFELSETVESTFEQNLFPAVAHDASGSFMVSWSNDYAEKPMARHFDASGAAMGPQLEVGHLDNSYYYYSDLGVAGDQFVVAWDTSPFGGSYNVWARPVPARTAPVCTRVPRIGCRTPTVPGRGLLKVSNASPDKGDRLIWKWVAGQATTLGDFGDPSTGDSFRLCVYDDAGASLPLRAAVLGGGTCSGRPCWKADGNGYRYVEKTALTDGVAKLVLKSGGAGEAKVVLKAKGDRMREGFSDFLPLGPPVRVQLVGSAGTCWEATYDTRVTTSTGALFQASPD